MLSIFVHGPTLDKYCTDFICQWSQQANNTTIAEAVAGNIAAMANLGVTASAADDISEQLDEGDADEDENIAPIKWKPARTSEQGRKFFGYYESRGFKTVSADKYPIKRFQPRPLNFKVDEPLVQFIRDPVQTGELDGDTWEYSPIVKTGPPSDLAVIETERQEKLETAKAELAVMEAEEATGEAEEATKEARLRTQRHLVATLSVPFRVFVPPVRQDNEEGVEAFDRQKTTVSISDKNCPDAAKETDRRYIATIELMKKNGAIPETRQERDIWGPAPKVKGLDEALGVDWSEGMEEELVPDPSDSMATSTFHGFLPSFHRPGRIGLAHLGYDDVYLQQRDGQAFTSADAPHRDWVLGDNIPFTFPESGRKELARNMLAVDNPAMLTARKDHLKPVLQLLEENERRNANTKAQRRGGMARGSAVVPRGRGDGSRVRHMYGPRSDDVVGW